MRALTDPHRRIQRPMLVNYVFVNHDDLCDEALSAPVQAHVDQYRRNMPEFDIPVPG